MRLVIPTRSINAAATECDQVFLVASLAPYAQKSSFRPATLQAGKSLAGHIRVRVRALLEIPGFLLGWITWGSRR